MTSNSGPPSAYAAFSLLLPCPGMGRYRSRGSDTSAELPVGERYKIIIVSVRCPATLPVPSFFCSAFDRPSRESLPTSRIAVPGCCAGRAPAGLASTFVVAFQAWIGTPMINATHTVARARRRRRCGRGGAGGLVCAGAARVAGEEFGLPRARGRRRLGGRRGHPLAPGPVG